MCIVCIDWEKGKLTPTEALRNLAEVAMPGDYEHNEKILQKILDKEIEDQKKAVPKP